MSKEIQFLGGQSSKRIEKSIHPSTEECMLIWFARNVLYMWGSYLPANHPYNQSKGAKKKFSMCFPPLVKG